MAQKALYYLLWALWVGLWTGPLGLGWDGIRVRAKGRDRVRARVGTGSGPGLGQTKYKYQVLSTR